MCLLEELISGQANSPASAEDVQEGDHDLGDDSPNDVLLLDESRVGFRLRLIESSFDQCPDQSVQEGLDENDTASPSMQEVEMLVRDTSDQGQDAFTRAECYCQWCQGIGQRADTITPASEACSDCLEFRVVFGRRDPSLVGNSDETVHKSALE